MAKQAQTAEEKLEILNQIRLEKRLHPHLNLPDLFAKHGIGKTSFYRWCREEKNNSLQPKSRTPHSFGNRINSEIEKSIIDVWEFDTSRSASEIHEFITSEGIDVSYTTVRKIISQRK